MNSSSNTLNSAVPRWLSYSTPFIFGLVLTLLPLVYLREVYFGDFVFKHWDMYNYNFTLRAYFWQLLGSGVFGAMYPFNSLGHSLFMNPHHMEWYPTNILFLFMDPNRAAHLDYLLHWPLAGFGWYLFCRRLTGSRAVSYATALFFTFNGIMIASHYRVEIYSFAWFAWAAWSFLRVCDLRDFRSAMVFGMFFSLIFLGGNPELMFLAVPFFLFSMTFAPGLDAKKLIFDVRFLSMLTLAAATYAAIALPILIRSQQDVPLTSRYFGFGMTVLYKFTDHPTSILELPGRWIPSWVTNYNFFPDIWQDFGQPWYQNHTIGIAATIFLLIGYGQYLGKWNMRLLAAVSILIWSLSLGPAGFFSNWVWLHVDPFQYIRFPGKFFRYAMMFNAIPLALGGLVIYQYMIKRWGYRLALRVMMVATVLNVAQVYYSLDEPYIQSYKDKLRLDVYGSLANKPHAPTDVRVMSCAPSSTDLFDARPLGIAMVMTGEASETVAVRAINCDYIRRPTYINLFGISHGVGRDPNLRPTLYKLKGANGPSYGLLSSDWYFADIQTVRKFKPTDNRVFNDGNSQDFDNLLAGKFPLEVSNYIDSKGYRKSLSLDHQREIKAYFDSEEPCEEKIASIPLKISPYVTSIQAEGNTQCPRLLSIPWSAIPGWKATVNNQPVPIFRVGDGVMGILVPKGDWKVDVEYDPPFFGASLFISLLTFIVCVVVGISSLVAYLRQYVQKGSSIPREVAFA